jgi:hypothetical protein
MMRQICAIALLFFACSCDREGAEGAKPCWGDPNYDVRPFIESAASYAAASNRAGEKLDYTWILSTDGSYYSVSVGKSLSDRFDPWFFLRITRDGQVLRLQENPETGEEAWVADAATRDR